VGTPFDVTVTGAAVFLLPVRMRVPLKFGAQVVEAITCARVAVEVRTASGRRAVGWGETPLSVGWAWPAPLDHALREAAMIRLVAATARGLVGCGLEGHALEIGAAFRRTELSRLARECAPEEIGGPIPELAALVSASACDLALHDAYGMVHGADVYATYEREHLSTDLAALFAADGADAATTAAFRGRFPADFLDPVPPRGLLAWHLVGGLDPLDAADLTGGEPRDGEPVTLVDWIVRDGLEALKVKLRGTDLDWDIDRLLRVGAIGLDRGVRHFCADFNCTVTDPAYVHAALDAVVKTAPRLAERLLYVEQPFPADITAHPIPVHGLAARTRLFLDESAHDWRHVAHGRELGWNGVALKTCKTQSGALLSACWARAHGMDLMVQDLTNPMLAALPHLRLAAHVGTIAGVETNAMQFYPAASAAEARVHPEAYRRRGGRVGLGSLAGPGFGMRVAEIGRPLPEPVAVSGSIAVEDLPGAAAARA
jgi:L-alanine-DL-glutamate epimerase-like enolase superfamily enzyme